MAFFRSSWVDTLKPITYIIADSSWLYKLIQCLLMTATSQKPFFLAYSWYIQYMSIETYYWWPFEVFNLTTEVTKNVYSAFVICQISTKWSAVVSTKGKHCRNAFCFTWCLVEIKFVQFHCKTIMIWFLVTFCCFLQKVIFFRFYQKFLKWVFLQFII